MQRRTSTASAVARYLISSLVAIAVIVVGSYFVLRSVAIREAERDTRQRVVLEGRLAQTALTESVLTGDRTALDRLDETIKGQILGDSVVRVKLWTRDGRILYSDQPRLIGQRFPLGQEESELFETGGADAELSDLAKPENRYERPEGKLLEAHTPVRTPESGTQLLFETYSASAPSAPAPRGAGARPRAAGRPTRADRDPGPAGLRPRPPSPTRA